MLPFIRPTIPEPDAWLPYLSASYAQRIFSNSGPAALRLEASRARDEADRAVSARNRMIRTIDQQRDLNAQLASELQAAQQKLQGLLAGSLKAFQILLCQNRG